MVPDGDKGAILAKVSSGFQAPGDKDGIWGHEANLAQQANRS
jgi:hypothetical protein